MADIILSVYLLILWSLLGLAALVTITYSRESHVPEEFLNPVHIYRYTSVNWFGCILLTLFYNLLCPMLSVGYWLYKLCTIGRKH